MTNIKKLDIKIHIQKTKDKQLSQAESNISVKLSNISAFQAECNISVKLGDISALPNDLIKLNAVSD